MILSGASGAIAAELHPETLTAWSNYVKTTEARILNERSSTQGFLSLDFQTAPKAAHDRQALRSGNILVEKVATGGSIKEIPEGRVHHWRGVVYIPGATLDSVLFRVENPNAENVKQEDVMDSRVLQKEPGQLRLFLKLQRSKIVTVVYNTEHLIHYGKNSDSKAWSSSVATKIAELDKGEREKPEGRDSGFLWKLNSYWRYEQVDGGVIVECESMTLSRSIPPVLSWMINPIIDSVARESMQRTLQSFRNRMNKSVPQSARQSCECEAMREYRA
jgi:hypothetical protein